MQGVDRALAGLQNKFKETGEKANGAFIADGQGALKEAAAIDRLRQEYDDLTKAVQKLKAAQKNAQDPRAIENFAREIAKGEAGLRKYERAAKDAGVGLGGITKGSNAAAEAVDALVGGITKATIIAAVISEVFSLIKSVVTLSDQIGRAEIQFRNFTGSAEAAEKQVASLVDFANRKFLNTDDVLSAGKSLLAFGIEAEKLESSLSQIADISAATGKNFNELAIIYGKAKTAGVLYAEDINQLVDAGIPIIQEFTKQLGVNEAEVKKLASEGRISFEELQLAFFNLTKEGATFAGQAETQAETFSGAWRAAGNNLKDLLLPLGTAIKDLGTQLGQLVNDGISAQKRINTALQDFSFNQIVTNPLNYLKAIQKARIQAAADAEADARQALIDREDAIDEQIRLEQEAAKKREELTKQGNAQAAKQAADQAARQKEAAEKLEIDKQRFLIDLMQDGIDKDLALAKFRYEANLREAKKYGVDATGVEEQYWLDTIEIAEKYSALTANEVADGLKKRLTEQEAALSISKQLADLDIQIQEERYAAAIAGLEAQGVDEERIRQAQAAADIRIQKLRLENEIKFLSDRLAILRASGDQQADVIAKQIELLQAQLGNLPSTFTTPTPQAPETPGGEGKTSIFDLLGIQVTPGEEEGILAAIEEVTSRTIDSIRQITAARVEAAETALRAADQQVQAAEDALAKEMELAEKGYASNVSLKQRELEEAKVQREKAVEQQRKAQRTQILLDTALQASSLATTVANLFKSLSALPLGTGIPIAIALSATMFAAFAKAKSDALRATRARYGLSGEIGKDGLIKGKSHSQGGVNLSVERGELLQVGSDGKRNRIAVVRKERTAQYWDLLDAANRNDRAELARNAFALAGIDSAAIVAPKVRKKQVSKSVAKGNQSADVGKLVAVQSDKKQTALLQAILSEMQRSNNGDKWTPDGKTKISGNTKTRYL